MRARLPQGVIRINDDNVDDDVGNGFSKRVF